MAKQISKKELINKIDEKIQALNLLKSALQHDKSRKPESLKPFYDNYASILHEK